MIAVLGEEDIPAVQAQLARRLGKTSAAVSEVIIRLEADGYITRSGRVINLTEEGRAVASAVIRRHRLAERLLVDVIGISWSAAHLEAGRWEHVISDAVEEHLVALLGDPATCPHGNPIPGSHNAAPTRSELIALSDVETGDLVPRGAHRRERRTGPAVAHLFGGRGLHPRRRRHSRRKAAGRYADARDRGRPASSRSLARATTARRPRLKPASRESCGPPGHAAVQGLGGHQGDERLSSRSFLVPYSARRAVLDPYVDHLCELPRTITDVQLVASEYQVSRRSRGSA